jgi:hypothetical protein
LTSTKKSIPTFTHTPQNISQKNKHWLVFDRVQQGRI